MRYALRAVRIDLNRKPRRPVVRRKLSAKNERCIKIIYYYKGRPTAVDELVRLGIREGHAEADKFLDKLTSKWTDLPKRKAGLKAQRRGV